MTRYISKRLTIAFAATALAWVSAPRADDGWFGGADGSLDDFGLRLLNPGSALFRVDNEITYRSFDGRLPESSDQKRWSWNLRPIVPIRLDSGNRLVLSLDIPWNLGEPTYETVGRDYVDWGIRQDALTIPTDRAFINGHSHLGDIAYGIAYARSGENGWYSMLGLTGVLPTGQDGSIERDQYLLGPDIVVGRYTDWGLLGGRLRHYANVADAAGTDNQYDTNETWVELTFAWALDNGWQIVSTPTVVYDWEAAPSNEWMIPLGGGVAKTTRFGRFPVRWSLELETYVESPEAFGVEWLLTFNVTPLLSDRSRP